ncbi:AAA family ATPase, partial [Vibrio parahaemolyticus]
MSYVFECVDSISSALAEADRLLVANKSTQETVQPSQLRLREGAHCGLEEDQTTEFKEIKGNNPKQSIQKPLDKYILSFLNSEGGSIYWGITDD